VSISRLVLPPLFGAVIGLVTNALAIRMLFRPYREVRLLGLRFQGTLPRRQPAIAGTVSRVVSSELLREEQVARRLAGPEVRAALGALVQTLAERYRGRWHGSLADVLGAPRRDTAEHFLARLLADLTGMAEHWLTTPDGQAAVEGWLEKLLELCPADLLRGEEAAVRAAASAHVTRLLADPRLEERLRPLVTWALVRLAGTDRRVDELLPPRLAEALQGAVQAVVPELLRRFEAALLAPANVARLKRAVRGGIRAYLAETEGGMVKNLIRQAALLGQGRLLREADQVVDANLHRLGELVHEESNRERLAEGVADAVAAALRQTPAQVLASLPPEIMAGLHDQLAASLASYLGGGEGRRFASRLVEAEFGRMFHTPLRQWVGPFGGAPYGRFPLSAWAEALCGWLGGGRLTQLVGRETRVLVRAVLDAPLRSDSGLLSEAVVAEVAELALDHLLPVLAARVPELLALIDVQGLIEREILAFSPQDVERVVLSVARRELRAITWWGAALGGAVGAVQSLLYYLAG